MCHLARCQKYKSKHKWDIAFFLNDVYVLVALISVNFLPLMSTWSPFFIDGQSGLSLNTELSHYSRFVYTLTHNIKSKPLHSDLSESLGRHDFRHPFSAHWEHLQMYTLFLMQNNTILLSLYPRAACWPLFAHPGTQQVLWSFTLKSMIKFLDKGHLPEYLPGERVVVYLEIDYGYLWNIYTPT